MFCALKVQNNNVLLFENVSSVYDVVKIIIGEPKLGAMLIKFVLFIRNVGTKYALYMFLILLEIIRSAQRKGT